MGLGVSFRVAPGVRLRASTRGVRASVGPRAARVPVGSGRTRIATGVGPVTASSGMGRGRSAPVRSTPTRVTEGQMQAQARAADRAAQVRAIADIEAELTALHLEQFPTPTRRVVPVPSSPSPQAVAKELYRDAVAHVPFWKFVARKAARAQAEHAAGREAGRRHSGVLVAVQLEQFEVDQRWAALSEHDPVTVIEAVDAAFADNASDSVCVDADTEVIAGEPVNYVTAIVQHGDVTLVPEQRPDITPGGKPTLRKRTKTDRNALYARAIASTVLATAKEALASAPSATEARVLVVRRSNGLGGLEPVFAGRFTRTLLRSVEWARHPDPLLIALEGEDVIFRTKGITQEVIALAVEPGTAAAQLIDALDQALLAHNQ